MPARRLPRPVLRFVISFRSEARRACCGSTAIQSFWAAARGNAVGMRVGGEGGVPRFKALVDLIQTACTILADATKANGAFFQSYPDNNNNDATDIRTSSHLKVATALQAIAKRYQLLWHTKHQATS